MKEKHSSVRANRPPSASYVSRVHLHKRTANERTAEGGAVVQRIRHLGLRSVGRGFKSCSRQRCVTTVGKLFCASVTKQYNLVPATGRLCSAAGEVTAGLAESNGSLPPGG